MIRKFFILCSAFLILAFLLPACSPAPEITAQYDPAEIRFSGERAYQIVEKFKEAGDKMKKKPKTEDATEQTK